MVVYAYSGRISENEAKEIQRFAHSKGKKTLSIGVRQAFTDLYVKADPFTLLAYIKNADYVVTDTFHGTVFSIKYQVPFGTMIRESNKEKITDLLDKINLSHRKLLDITFIENVMNDKIDRNKLITKINDFSNQAKVYLKINI